MGVPVTIEDPDDVKYAVLGDAAGYSAFEAVGRMAKLWSYCTARQTGILSEALVRGFLGQDGVAAIVTSEFGELADGGVRVRGTQGRIDWYADAYIRKERKRAGGIARAAGAPREGGRFVTSSSPAAHQQPPAGAGDAGAGAWKAGSAPATPFTSSDQLPPAAHQQATSRPPAGHQHSPASDSDLFSERESQPARARDPAVALPVPQPLPATRYPVAEPVDDRARRRGEILRAIAPLHAETYNRVRRIIGSSAVSLQPVGDVHERTLRELLLTLPSLEDVEDRCLKVLAVREAEALRDGSVQYLGASVWHPTSYARALTMTVAEASTHRDRAGPRGSSPPPQSPPPARRRLAAEPGDT